MATRNTTQIEKHVKDQVTEIVKGTLPTCLNFAVEKIRETKPDYVFILPWNLTREITQQCEYIREWGGKFIIPIPEVKII